MKRIYRRKIIEFIKKNHNFQKHFIVRVRGRDQGEGSGLTLASMRLACRTLKGLYLVLDLEILFSYFHRSTSIC